METSDLFSLLLAAYKDKVERESLDRLKEELRAVIVEDAEMRRMTTAAKIRQMAKLRIALCRFEISYNKIKDAYGDVDAVNDYIAAVHRRIKEISIEKNR